MKGNVAPIVDDKERDYRKIPPSWHVYSYPRGNMSRFEPSKVDDRDQLGKNSHSTVTTLTWKIHIRLPRTV